MFVSVSGSCNGAVSIGLTCANVRCAAGTHCEMNTIMCIKAPCPSSGPRCVNDTVTEQPVLTCATVNCISGTHCEMEDVPRCVADPTCETVDCATGKRCVLVQVQCFTTPCYPLPMCVDIPSSTTETSS